MRCCDSITLVLSYLCFLFFFFFQAEDGIRDLTVTGVQTCALPISTDFSDRVLAALAETPTVCEHVHLPAQSGSSRVLKRIDRKSTRLNSSHSQISYAVFCLKKKKKPLLLHDRSRGRDHRLFVGPVG